MLYTSKSKLLVTYLFIRVFSIENKKLKKDGFEIISNILKLRYVYFKYVFLKIVFEEF
jgi:hypothetical protein